MSVVDTDKLINDICQVFFQHWEHDVMAAATGWLCCHEWSPGFVLLVASIIHGPKLKMAKQNQNLVTDNIGINIHDTTMSQMHDIGIWASVVVMTCKGIAQ
jgi:hypothetical protein